MASDLRPGRIALGGASCEISYFGPVAATLRGRLREITSLEVASSERRQRAATELMREVCRIADQERVTLIIKPEAYPVGDALPGLCGAPLAQWYARAFGFFTLQQTPVLLMVRLPGEVQPTGRIGNVKAAGSNPDDAAAP